ncbi:transposase [Hymenobacter terricola]|uniref:transposase n=1 Tax=Hymenobacter terricola TaxID=2819236 RepID=UPI001B3016D1|nr:transposase [Hymenobacter terricola]
MEKASSSKRPRYDAALRAEARQPARESRSTRAAARALNINATLLYQWQKAAQQPLPTDPTEAAEVRALRIANKRLAQELDMLKKANAKCLL